MNKSKYHSLQAKSVLQSRFELLKVLSVSDLSIVYLAKDLQEHQLCTVKEFYPKKMALRDMDHQTVLFRFPSLKEKFQNALEIFFNEALILREIHHPYVVQYIDHFTQNNTGYIVTKYCKGSTLEEFIQSEQNISIRVFLKTIYLPVLNAMNEIHRKGIIHRDIKPSNILINTKKEPLIIDFGSAVKYKKNFPKTIFVTPGFSPLEFYSATSKQGPFSDIYSLAATLYYYLCGKAPVEVGKRVIVDPIEDVVKYNDLISPWLAKTIMKNLSVDSKKRFSSVQYLKLIAWRETFRIQ